MLPVSRLEVVCPTQVEMTREREFLQILAHDIFVSLCLAAGGSLAVGRLGQQQDAPCGEALSSQVL